LFRVHCFSLLFKTATLQIVKDNKKWKNNRNNDTGKPQQITTIANQFAVLSEITSDCDRQKQAEGVSKKQAAKNRKETGENKIILMGDSHMKGYASKLSNRLDRKFEVMGTVMPGARTQNIVQLCEQEVNSLTGDDMILWGGSNDVAKNETMNGLRHLRKFISRKKNTNLILITIPHRYDLMDFSCVNEEIKVFNRKMHKIMKLESNVEILDIKLDRSCYTRHGLHLNRMGKERVEEMLINQIQTFTTKDKGNIIAQSWIHNLDEHCHVEESDKISPEIEELQLKDGKEEEDCENENFE
jgi:capsular polysaccharide biosynthesis protein